MAKRRRESFDSHIEMLEENSPLSQTLSVFCSVWSLAWSSVGDRVKLVWGSRWGARLSRPGLVKSHDEWNKRREHGERWRIKTRDRKKKVAGVGKRMHKYVGIRSNENKSNTLHLYSTCVTVTKLLKISPLTRFIASSLAREELDLK